MSLVNALIGLPRFLGALTNKETIPASESATGTITHTSGSKIVTGTGTKFKSELQVGQYIFISSIPAIRKITDIDSDARLLIDSSFGSTLTAVTFKKVRSGIYSYLRLENNHATVAAVVDGNNLPASKFVEYSNPTGSLGPILYDASSSSLLVSAIEIGK